MQPSRARSLEIDGVAMQLLRDQILLYTRSYSTLDPTLHQILLYTSSCSCGSVLRVCLAGLSCVSVLRICTPAYSTLCFTGRVDQTGGGGGGGGRRGA